MAVLNQEIYIGSVSSPLFYFDKDHVIDPSSLQGVDLIEEKLSIDTFEPTVLYDGNDYEGLRTLPFGTPIYYYTNSVLTYKFYINTIERRSKKAFKLNCISAVGVLDKSYHAGGVYYGTPFEDIIEELIGNIFPYSTAPDVAATKIFGWLPYDTKRNNLHQLMFAINATVLKDANGDIYFDFVKDTETPTIIDDNRMYIDGSVEYPKIATEINVTEHSYQYANTVEPISLYDNSEAIPVDNLFVLFNNAPIVVSTIQATSGLQIIERHENYAIVSGLGILTGVPYVDKTSIVRRYYTSSGENYTVSVSDATLVTAMNSAYVADRLKSYYTSAKIVKGDVKLAGEKTGHRYQFTDAFGETVTGYLKKATIYPSSFLKAQCEFVTGYVSDKYGNAYDYHLAIDTPGTLTVPSGTKSMRVVLIGGGDGASSGLAGEEPDNDTSSVQKVFGNQNGGKGGEPGEEGLGGLIREIIITDPLAGDWKCVLGPGGEGTDWNDSEEEHLKSDDYEGAHTILYAPNNQASFSTDDPRSYRSDSGIADLFTGVVYGKRGLPGVKGGNGGRGSTNGPGEDGEDVVYRGLTRYGGAGGNGVSFTFNRVSRTVNGGGGGGNGANAYVNGRSGSDAKITWYYDATEASPGYKAVEYVGIVGGSPVTMVTPSLPLFEHSPGDGGYAGCGGAGRGGYGNADRFLDKYEVEEDGQTLNVFLQADLFNIEGTVYYSHSGPGGPGEKGQAGAMIIYSDKELTYTPNVLAAPVLTNTTTASSTSNTFSFVTVGSNITYDIERRPLDGSWLKFDRVVYSQNNTTVTYTDSSTELGESFEYRVKAIGLGEAKDSEYSNSIVAAWGVSKLSTPVLTAQQQPWGIVVSWTAVEHATAYLFAYRIVDSGNQWSQSIFYSASMTELVGLLSPIDNFGYQYEMKICAIVSDKSYAASDWSSTVRAYMPTECKAAAPVITSAEYYDAGGEYDTDGIMIRWKINFITTNEKYTIQKKYHDAPEGTWETIKVLDTPIQGYYFDSFPTRVDDVYDYRIQSTKTGWADSDWSDTYTVIVIHLLPAPTFDSLADSGNDYITLNVNVINIDTHAEYIVFETNINNAGWQMYKSPIPLTGSQSYSGTYSEAISGGSIKYGGTIQIRCYLTASGYPNSDYSEIKTISMKERVFFWDYETSQSWDYTLGSYVTGLTNGWAGYELYHDSGEGYDYHYGAPIFTTGADNDIELASDSPGGGGLFTKNKVCADTSSLASIYSKICLYGTLKKQYASGFCRFGSVNLFRRSDGYTRVDWRNSGSYGGNSYIEPGSGGVDPTAGELTNPSVAPNNKRAYDVGWGIGTYVGFQINGGGMKAYAVFAIKR